MPLGDTVPPNSTAKRILVYGKAKTKKTWWALRAAEFGYNVLFLNGENNIEVMQQLPLAARRRIIMLNVYDRIDRPVFIDMFIKFAADYLIRWDDDENRMVTMGTKAHPEHNHVLLNLAKCTRNDVIIVDTWTSLVVSMVFQYYLDNGIDVTKAAKQDRDAYGYQDRIGDWLMKQFMSFPCHIIVVGHETVVDLTKKQLNEKGAVVDLPIGEQHTQLISSSRTHSKKIAKNFTDVLWFHLEGTNVWIDSRSNEAQDGGSSSVHANESWEKLHVGRILGTCTNTERSEGFIYYPPGEIPQPGTKSVAAGASTTVPARSVATSAVEPIGTGSEGGAQPVSGLRMRVKVPTT